jgi:F-type H+-transporting ATPase subunit O
MVKTPVQVFGIDGRYATALYSAATKQKSLERVEKEMLSVRDLYRDHPKFHEVVVKPTYKIKDKKAAMEAILKSMGHSDIMQNFFGVVAENGRLKLLEGMVKKFEQLMSAHRGEVSCEVVTAKPLDAAQKKELDTVLQSFIMKGEKLNIHTRVDPSILGGLIVNIGDKYVDMSIATKIKNYENLLHEAI